jgi:hypothetical protein
VVLIARRALRVTCDRGGGQAGGENLVVRAAVGDGGPIEKTQKEGVSVMFLYQRMLRVTGGPAAVAWAADITALVNKHATAEVSLWVGSFGAPPGTIGWSAMLEKLSQVDELNAKMAADGDVAAKLADAPKYVAEAQPDRLISLVHGEITDSAPVGSHVGVVRAMAAPGKWAAAGAWAVHIAGVYTETTGLDVVVGATSAGPMGEYTWYVRHADADSIQDSMEATMSSEKYVTEVEGGGEFFLPGAMQMVAQRLA